jgi:hypothetical protein
VTLAEFLGFGVPALVGAGSTGWPPGWGVLALAGAGAVEGAVLGFAQAVVLRRVLGPRLDRRRFVAATAAGAALAYLVVLVPINLADRLGDLPLLVLVVLGIVVGTVVLASIGTAQWLVLRAALPHSASWIATTAAAWAVGLLAFTAVTTPLWQPGQPLALVVAIGVLGGLVMAAAVAAITGAGLVLLLRRHA